MIKRKCPMCGLHHSQYRICKNCNCLCKDCYENPYFSKTKGYKRIKIEEK